MTGEWVMVCWGSAHNPEWGRQWEGQMLAAFDNDYGDGRGTCVWTHDPAKALRFNDATAVMATWQSVSTVRPVRPDGKPNRPLTAFHIEPYRLKATMADGDSRGS